MGKEPMTLGEAMRSSEGTPPAAEAVAETPPAPPAVETDDLSQPPEAEVPAEIEAPAVEGEQPPAAEPDPTQAHIRRLEEDTATLREQNQQLLNRSAEQMAAVNAKLIALLEQKRPGEPEKTPEQIEKEKEAFWAGFEKDPSGTLKQNFDSAVKNLDVSKAVQDAVSNAVKKEMEGLAPFMREATKLKNYQALGEVEGFEKVKDPKFRDLMESKDNVAGVWNRFYKGKSTEEAEGVFKDPVFYERLYHAAEALSRTQPPAPGKTVPTVPDPKDKLRQIAQSQGVVGSPAGKAGGKAPETDPVIAGIRKAGGVGLGSLSAKANWKAS